MVGLFTFVININNMLSWYIWDFEITMREIVASMVEATFLRRKHLFRKYELYRRRHHVYTRMLEEGYKYADWKRANREGLLCTMDHTSFKEARELDENEFWRLQGDEMEGTGI